MDFLSFLNIPSVILKKSKISHDYLEYLFKTKEEQGSKWEKEYFTAFFNQDFKTANKIQGLTPINLYTYFLDYLISSFTAEDQQTTKYLTEIFLDERIKKVKNIYKTKNQIHILTNKGWVSAIKFSSINHPMTKYFKNLTDINHRVGKCHSYAVNLALKSDFDCTLATGYVASFSKKSKYLHSWIETTFNHQEYVIDLTRNAIFNKHGYYQIKNIYGPVYKIPASTIKNEEALIKRISNHDATLSKLYLSNRPLALKVFEEQTKNTINYNQ